MIPERYEESLVIERFGGGGCSAITGKSRSRSRTAGRRRGSSAGSEGSGPGSAMAVAEDEEESLLDRSLCREILGDVADRGGDGIVVGGRGRRPRSDSMAAYDDGMASFQDSAVHEEW